MANPSSGYSGKLRARSGTEGSTRGLAESPWYAPSEGGRGEGSRSIGIPSPYDRSETQGSGHVSYRHTARRRPHRPSDEEATAPHTAYSESRYEGSSRDYAMGSNDRDFHAPPAVRVPSSEDAPTFRSERRHTANNAASFNGRISTTPSVLAAHNDPPLTRRGQNLPRSTTSTRQPETRNPILTGITAPSTNLPRRALKTGPSFPSSITKRVRFESTVPGSSPPLSHISPSHPLTTPHTLSDPLSPPHPSGTSHPSSHPSVAPNSLSKEEADTSKKMPNPEAVQPRARPSLVAMVLRVIGHLLGKVLFIFLSVPQLHLESIVILELGVCPLSYGVVDDELPPDLPPLNHLIIFLSESPHYYGN
jgi:hypothetical protein